VFTKHNFIFRTLNIIIIIIIIKDRRLRNQSTFDRKDNNILFDILLTQ